MRKRITRALFTATAAGVTITTLGFAAASPAGAAAGKHPRYFTPNGTVVATNAQCTVTPLPSDNCGMAGYQASGRNFRFASALITVPNHVAVTEASPADPTLYVALDNSSTNTYEYARVGIVPCAAGTPDADDFIVPGVTFTAAGITTCPASGWMVFDAVNQPVSGTTVHAAPLSNSLLGDGILVSAYLSANGNQVETSITLPTGVVIQHVIPVTGPTYTKAQALADWTTAIEGGAGPPERAVPAEKIRDTQFFQGRFTTLGGVQGTFNGPWTLTAFEATTNGFLPPTGTLIAQPSFLWNDGHGFGGQGDDAFGVWRFPF